MKLYYSGATKYLAEQKLPSSSLGGYISSTVIPNDYPSSIFSPISLYNSQNRKKQTRLIVLKNDLSYTALDTKLNFKLDSNSICDYSFSLVSPAKNSKNEYYFEQISNDQSLPYEADFEPIVSDVKIDIGQLDSSKSIGIWIIKNLKKDALGVKSCDSFLEDVATKDIENISIEIEYQKEQSISVSDSISNS